MKYHYSSYWHSWSRVLSDNHDHGPFVEVNLTPHGIRGSAADWRRVAQIIIRVHGTTRDPNDQETDRLPREIVFLMLDHLGMGLLARLLNEDFLSEIDWSLYEKHNNGGAAFEDIRRR